MEKVAGNGSFDLNLSPYGVIMQGLLRHRTDSCAALSNAENSRVRLVVTREVQVPAGLDVAAARNVLVVP
jgi:hypothetical protein